MADVYYWLLVHEPWLFGKKKYFCFDKQGNESSTENPAMAMRWTELYAAEYAATLLTSDWAPILIEFKGSALCGGVEASPTSTQ